LDDLRWDAEAHAVRLAAGSRDHNRKSPAAFCGKSASQTGAAPMAAPGRRGDARREMAAVLDAYAVDALVATLWARGFRVLGPTVRDGAVVYDELQSADELPVGWTDVQEAGAYQLVRRTDNAMFGFAVGPHSWKQFLFPPRVSLWQAHRHDGGFEVEEPANG